MSAGYLAGCAGKQKYETKEKAARVRDWRIWSGEISRSGTNTYRCKHCRFFHLGHIGAKRRRMRGQ